MVEAKAIEVIASPTTAFADGTETILVSVTRLTADGKPVVGANVTLAATGTGNVLTPATGSTNAQGVFSATIASTVAEGKTITATSDGLTATANATFTVAQGKLVFSTNPTNVPAGVVMDPMPVVTLTDAAGNPIVSGGKIVPVSVGVADNAAAGWLAGTTSVNALGFANFPTLSISEPGTGYHLIATAPGFKGATSSAFDVTAGAWRHLAAGPPGIQDGFSLAIDPNDGTMYMATTDGVWRSTDNATTWIPLRRGLLSNSNYADLWVDPASSHVYAAGPGGFYVSADRGRTWTNKRQAGSTKVRSTRALPGRVIVAMGGGIWWTPDEGVTWTQATGYPNGQPFGLNFDPKNPQIVYAGNQGQLYRSDNAGVSFAPVGPKAALPIVGVQPDATTAGKVFIGADYGGIQASLNFGQDFTPVGTQPTNQINSLAVDPTDSKRIYAGTYQGFLRTENGGTDWLLTKPLGSQTTYNTLLDPRTPSTVYTFGSQALLRSIDYGATFGPGTNGASFVSVRSMVASGSNVYASVIARGVWKSTDGGQTWAQASTGLTTDSVGTLAMDPANASRIFVTTSNGLFVTTNGAGDWTKATSDLDSAQIGFLAIGSGGVMYAASSSSFHKSITDGASWTTIYPTYSPQITGLATSPADPNTVYLATTGALRKSTTGGGTGTWSSAISGGTFLNVIIDPTDANHVYAAGASQLQYTTNGFTDSLGSGAASVSGSTIALDPSDPLTVYVARDGARAWKSKDGGKVFTPITSGLYDDVYTFAVPSGGNGVVYAGTLRSGIFKTTTGGE